MAFEFSMQPKMAVASHMLGLQAHPPQLAHAVLGTEPRYQALCHLSSLTGPFEASELPPFPSQQQMLLSLKVIRTPLSQTPLLL